MDVADIDINAIIKMAHVTKNGKITSSTLQLNKINTTSRNRISYLKINYFKSNYVEQFIFPNMVLCSVMAAILQMVYMVQFFQRRIAHVTKNGKITSSTL
jgi:hypothetical protein